MRATVGDSFERELPEPGSHVARCVRVIDLGTQENRWNETVNWKHKILVAWELPYEEITWDDPEGNEQTGPMLVFKRYTLSMHENANLRRDAETWWGREFREEELTDGFDPKLMLDRPCFVLISHSEDGKWANVKGVMALTKGTECPARKSELVWFDLDEFDRDTYDSLSPRLQETIAESDEYKGLRFDPESGAPPPITDADVPFSWVPILIALGTWGAL